jgi:Arc/MetJ-type ribon-helix-helix transcriptional regulator
MSKITFRADDDLVAQLEEFDASKSEVMREALREYLDDSPGPSAEEGTLDGLVAERVDALVADRLNGAFTPGGGQDINVNITLEGATEESATVSTESDAGRKTTGAERETEAVNEENAPESARNTCAQCGEDLGESHVYCPNCGEKAARRVFCDCGDELRSDWSFCPGCGRRTPAADVLDQP